MTIIEKNPNGDEAHFSEDRDHRYLLRRFLKNKDGSPRAPKVVAFCMLNPSTANAFKNDNTVTKCLRFADSWLASELQVVNLFSFRTPKPEELYTAPVRGTDALNDSVIIGAMQSADLAIAAWGNHGELDGRGVYIHTLLVEQGVKLLHLGTTQGGIPKHPLARGKAWIPYTQQPVEWK